MDERTLAYVAGFFDGEGSIAMSRRQRNITCSAIIVNTDRDSLDWLQGLFGGHVYSHDPQVKPDNWRLCYQWHLNGKDAETFIAAIAPFLRIKAALAGNALTFLACKRQNERKGRATAPDLMAQLEALYARHKLLITRSRPDAVETPEPEPSPQLRLLDA